MNENVIQFPGKRVRHEFVDHLGARPFHEVAKQAERMGAWIHYCNCRGKRVYIRHGHSCSVCGMGENL